MIVHLIHLIHISEHVLYVLMFASTCFTAMAGGEGCQWKRSTAFVPWRSAWRKGFHGGGDMDRPHSFMDTWSNPTKPPMPGSLSQSFRGSTALDQRKGKRGALGDWSMFEVAWVMFSLSIRFTRAWKSHAACDIVATDGYWYDHRKSMLGFDSLFHALIISSSYIVLHCLQGTKVPTCGPGICFPLSHCNQPLDRCSKV